MQSFFFRKSALIAAVLCCTAGNGQIVPPVKAYPYIAITPSSPVANRDSVTLSLALGSASNSCMAPTFTGISFTLQQSPILIYPPIFTVVLSYTMVPVPPNTVCPDLYAPVDYGPTFKLGKLAQGTYNVTDQNTQKQVGSFSVSNATNTLSDTVYVTPPKPTAKDSLHFDLFNAKFSCCTQYFNKTVSVSDTVILLSFEYLDNNACECLVAGSHTAFACGPQKTGTYAIYKLESIYCPPGQTCPLGLVRAVRVGRVTVTIPTATIAARGNSIKETFSLVESKTGVRWSCSLARTGFVSAAVFNARGARVAQIYKGTLAAGAHGFSWNAAAPGIYFLSVEIDGSQVIARKINIAR